MPSTLAAHADQFLYAPTESSNSENNRDESSPFDCGTPTKTTTTKPPMIPNKQTTKTSEYCYEDGPSFDCQEPPLEMVEGVKVDFMGSTPVKSNKSSHDAAASAGRDNEDDATVMTEPITPSPFKMMTPASSMKKSSSFASGSRGIRRSQQGFHEEESPFDEAPFDESPSMEHEDDVVLRLDTGVASPTVMAKRSNRNLEEQEPGPLRPRVHNRSRASQRKQNEPTVASPSSSPYSAPINLEKRVSVQLPAAKSPRPKDYLGPSAHSTSQEEADADYEADDDTICTGISETSSLPTAKKRVGRKKVEMKYLNTSDKPGIEEWCLSNVFDNIATDAALDVADWVTEGYAEGRKNVKTLVTDCLVPLKANNGGLNGKADCCGNDGEEMIQLLLATNERSDLHLKEVETRKPKRNMPKRERKYTSRGSTMDDIDEEEEYGDSDQYSKLRSRKSDYPKRESKMTEARTEASFKLATPTVLTRTRSLLEDTPTDDAVTCAQSPEILNGRATTDRNLATSRIDSTTATAADSVSIHQQIEKKDEDNGSVKSTVTKPSISQAQDETRQQQQQPKGEEEDDDSVLDQAAEMAAVVGTMSSSVPSQREKRNSPEDRGSETNTNAAKKEDRPGQFKIPIVPQKLTMAKAKEVLKAAKSNNGAIPPHPMFLEMEPEPKYADTDPTKKKLKWPPKEMQPCQQASNPRPMAHKPPLRKSKAVDRFGYMAALKDNSNTTKKEKENATVGEWW